MSASKVSAPKRLLVAGAAVLSLGAGVAATVDSTPALDAGNSLRKAAVVKVQPGGNSLNDTLGNSLGNSL